jgi:hypothetical protein
VGNGSGSVAGTEWVLRKVKGLLEGVSQALRIDGLNGREERDVRQILHARVQARSRHRVRVELLGDVRLDRVEAQRGRRDAREGEDVFRHHDLRLTEDRIAEGDVDAEGLSVELTGELAFRTKARPPLSVAASPSTATTRARKRSNTRSCRLRANSAPVFADVRRRCSRACLKASGEE